MSECIIDIEHLQKIYAEVTPLKDVNAKINKGDVITIIGPSGTGKSTLLRCINQLEEASSGKIMVFGHDVTKKTTDINQIRQRMGMVFQSFCLFKNLTLLDNIIAAPMDLKKVPRDQATKRAKELLEIVGLKGREESFPSELSGGQQQRAAIARVLAMDPEIILFDEPTSALDPESVQEVQEVIARLAESEITMLIVTHDMEFARNVSNRVFFMYDGIIYEDGSPEQIFDAPQKEKTRAFINQGKILKLKINSEDFNFDKTMKNIQDFLSKKGISLRKSLKIQSLFEEIVAVNLIEKDYPIGEIQLVLTLGKPINIQVSYSGERRNPLEEADNLSLKIIENNAKCYFKYHDNINEVSAIVK